MYCAQHTTGICRERLEYEWRLRQRSGGLIHGNTPLFRRVDTMAYFEEMRKDDTYDQIDLFTKMYDIQICT